MTVALVVAVTVPGALVLLMSGAFTLAHTVDEVFGEREPFWDYAHDLTGIRLPWLTGAVLFALLAGALAAVAGWGYLWRDAVALSLLAGLRLGDALASHFGLWALYRPENPGLLTSALYLLEVAVLAMWWSDLSAGPFVPAAFALGFCLFALPWIYFLLIPRGQNQ